MKLSNTIHRKIKSIEQTGSMKEFRAKLKICDPEIQHFVAALEAENLKLQKQIAKLQVENIKLDGWITILEENANTRCIHKEPPVECLSKSFEQALKLKRELEKNIDEKQLKIKR